LIYGFLITVIETIFNTIGGLIKKFRLYLKLLKHALQLKVLYARSKDVDVDIVISPLADEPLISDILAGSLEIAVEDFAKGF